jgi:hypothetical protein
MPFVGEGAILADPVAYPRYNQHCTPIHDSTVEFLRKSFEIKVLVLAAAWAGYKPYLYRKSPSELSEARGVELIREGFADFAAAVSRPDVAWLVISDVPPRMSYDLGCLFRDGAVLRRNCPDDMFKTPIHRLSTHLSTQQIIRDLPARLPNVSVLIPPDVMCDAKGCPTSLDGEFLYRDAGHLRRNMPPETRAKLARMLGLYEALGKLAGNGLAHARSGEMAAN